MLLGYIHALFSSIGGIFLCLFSPSLVAFSSVSTNGLLKKNRAYRLIRAHKDSLQLPRAKLDLILSVTPGSGFAIYPLRMCWFGKLRNKTALTHVCCSEYEFVCSSNAPLLVLGVCCHSVLVLVAGSKRKSFVNWLLCLSFSTELDACISNSTPSIQSCSYKTVCFRYVLAKQNL